MLPFFWLTIRTLARYFVKPLPNFNFNSITTFEQAVSEIKNQINHLTKIIDDCDDQFTMRDREQLVENIRWLKQFYEKAERVLLNGN